MVIVLHQDAIQSNPTIEPARERNQQLKGFKLGGVSFSANLPSALLHQGAVYFLFLFSSYKHPLCYSSFPPLPATSTMISSTVLMIFQVILVVSLALAFMLGSTWLFTNLRFYLQFKRLETGKVAHSTMEPLMLPYVIPWVGSATDLLGEQASFWAKLR